MTEFEFELVVRCITGQATGYEQEKLKVWLKEDENRTRYEEIRAIWIASGEVYKDYSPDLARARKKIQNGIDPAVKLAPWKWAGRAAAILVAAVGALWAIAEYSANVNVRQLPMVEISTGSAMDSVTLSDGSVIWLNRETTLKFLGEFTGPERRVFLNGEAFFKVVHNPEKPFIVEANGTATKVLGTSFNIKSSKDNIVVSVRTGKVLFFEHDNVRNCELLVKDQMAAFSPSSRSIRKSAIDGSKLPFWKNHPLAFKNTPLADVATKLSAYYDITIDLDPAIPENLSLTSSFEDQGAEEVLEVVCMTLDLKLERTTRGYRIIK